MIDTASVAPPSTSASSPAEIWQTRLVAAKSEGLTAAEIATRHGVAESTVFAWRKRLFGPKVANTTRVQFARIEPARTTRATEVRIEVAGIQIFVRPNDDLAFVTKVARALAEAAR
jgi:hypothetical protein